MTEGEDPPDRRQHGYKELEEKLNAHAEQIEKRLQDSILRAMIAFAVIGLTSALSLVGFGLLLTQQNHNSAAIQNQRRESIYRSCTEQDGRHDDALLQLDLIADKAAKKNPSQQRQIRAAVKANRTVIEAIVPKRNCATLVNASVKGT